MANSDNPTNNKKREADNKISRRDFIGNTL